MIDREQLDNQMRLMSESIDFDQLERDGILRKAGAWYEVLDMSRLPEHVRAQAVAVSGSTSGGTLPRLQFRNRK
jgi:hypothetical protein